MDVTQRLQDVISNWHVPPKGFLLEQLYKDCCGIVGPARHLLPLDIYLVKELDATNLENFMRRRRLSIRFRVEPIGRFEMAMVPAQRAGDKEKGFILVLDEDLKPVDQVALFGHAVAHLIRNQQDRDTGRPISLDPESDFVHIDKLNELRYFDIAQNQDKLNRDALEACPKLRRLLEPPEEGPTAQRQVRQSLERILRRKGWRGQSVKMPFQYTEGRVLPTVNGETRRGRRKTIDAELRIPNSLPVAALHLQRSGELETVALRRVRAAGDDLKVPFGYVITERGEVIEYDWTTGNYDATNFTMRSELPVQAELEERWFQSLQLTEEKEREALKYSFQVSRVTPRYYQEAAINLAIIAVLQARRGLRLNRILLTLATGTGKTQVAFQILWKLSQKRNTRRILFLADRGYLLDQAQYRDFSPFGDALARGSGGIDIVHDFLFASYQWLTNVRSDSDQPNYLDYPPDYFDIIVIDECHRGSADEDSNWRKVLTHFSSAVQIGLTATPLATKDVQTRAYFGDPIYTYSLSQGINDGYLAPYHVHYIRLGRKVKQETASETSDSQQPQTREFFLQALPEEGTTGQPQEDLPPDIVMETAKAMRDYTPAIAQHLAQFLRQCDPQAKTIVFCVDNDHADKMRRALTAACADFARDGDIVRIVDDDGLEGKRLLGDFCTPRARQPVIVTTSRLLSTGVDVPTCKNIVLARGVGSIVEFKQIIGRGTRLYTSNPQKNWFTILDYAGAIKHFFDRDFDGNPEYIQTDELDVDASPAQESQEHTPEQEPGTDQPSTRTITSESETVQSTATEADKTQDTQGTQTEAGGAAHDGSAGGETSESSQTLADVTDHIPYNSGDTGEASTGNDAATSTTAQTPPLSQNIVKETPDLAGTSQGLALIGAEQQGEAHTLGYNKSTGHEYRVVGEIIYELGPDGRTLRTGTASEFARQALRDSVSTPESLRALWISKEGRRDIKEQLEHEIVTPEELSEELKLPDVDVLDLLLYLIFQIQPLTRAQRVARLRQLHSDFFQSFATPPLAGKVLDAILEKYIRGEAPNVSDPGLLGVQPLTSLGTRMELSMAFSAGPTKKPVYKVLQELQALLYSF